MGSTPVAAALRGRSLARLVRTQKDHYVVTQSIFKQGMSFMAKSVSSSFRLDQIGQIAVPVTDIDRAVAFLSRHSRNAIPFSGTAWFRLFQLWWRSTYAKCSS